MKLNWISYKSFNLKDYEFYEKLENGDLNWIIPNKIIAFSSPHSVSQNKDIDLPTPDDYIPIFKKLNVTLVIWLNNPKYDWHKFVRAGIDHMDLYFLDGSTPGHEII